MKVLFAAMLVCTSFILAQPVLPQSALSGNWLGTLDVGAEKLRLVFHVVENADGITATLDSLDQNAKGIPVSAVTRKGMVVSMEVKAVRGTFEGQLDEDLSVIRGTWTQGSSLPLTLRRVKDPTELEVRRPQEPKRPYPYREEDVTYENASAAIKLAGTITIPAGKGPFTAVLLISGSGPHDRDGAMYGHKPFLVLADYLSRNGIVVLRSDDRGIGKSGGSFGTATTADFATDAEAGVAYLKTRNEVNPKRIGLVGHSEGGTIAPMVAARNRNVAYIVMMAGPAVPGDQILVEQIRGLAEAAGASAERVEEARIEEREILAIAKTENDPAARAKALREKFANVPESEAAARLRRLETPWFRYFLEYDPAIALRRVTCPVLALNGSKDTQVSSAQNLPAIRKALEAAGNQSFEIVEMPGLNHLFQQAKTGAPSEYWQIDETMAPVVLEKVAGWIQQRQPIDATAVAGR